MRPKYVYIHVDAIGDLLVNIPKMPEIHPKLGFELFQCPGFYVRRASRAMTQLYDQALAKVNIRGTQFTLLMAISLFGDRGLSRLAGGLATNRTTLTRTVDGLARRGWVRESDRDDHRTRPLSLTPDGEKKLAEAYDIWRKVHDRVTADLGEDAVAELIGMSDRIVEMVERAAE